jgi:thioredoxin
MRYLFLFLLIASLLFSACSKGQNTAQVLAPKEFAAKMSATPDAYIIDVRTPEEFSGDHLPQALNINWNSPDFAEKISAYDKNKTAFVYCLSGGRSGQAAAKMRAMGFKEVYELKGGLMKWNSDGMTSNGAALQQGMTREEYNSLLASGKVVLIDFYADWCAPCKKMEPYLRELSSEMAGRLVIVRIDADANKSIAKELQIDAMPVLLLYQDQQEQWKHSGYISKEDLVKKLPLN